MELEHKKNNEFYKNCNVYFEFLRKKGTMDFDFNSVLKSITAILEN